MMLNKISSLIIAFGLAFNLHAQTNEPVCTHGMVASVNPVASAAGVKVLKSGGNAIDAAVAIGLTLGVTDTANSGIGGGCFMLIHLADGRNIALDGREMAPAAATHDMFVRDGKGDTELSQTGALASGVPGELAAFDYAVHHYGKKSLSALILPAADLAAQGFEISSNYARSRLRPERTNIAKFPASRAVFFINDAPLKAGDWFKQPDLATTYRGIAKRGAKWFYRGPFSQAADAWMKDNGGLLTAKDFADYHIEVRDTIETSYRGYRVVSFPPPSSGGVHVLEMLNILENFDLKNADEAPLGIVPSHRRASDEARFRRPTAYRGWAIPITQRCRAD